MYGTITNLRYQIRAQQLAQQITQIVPGSGRTGITLGYTRTAGRAIIEVDPFQSWCTTADTPADSPGLQIGRWRVWVEDQLIASQHFWHPLTTTSGGN